MSYRIPRRLAWVVRPPAGDRQDAAAYLLVLPDGDPLVLTGTAALLWVLAGDREPDVPGALADLLGVPRDEVAETSLAYLRDLVDRGLLEVAS